MLGIDIATIEPYCGFIIINKYSITSKMMEATNAYWYSIALAKDRQG
jgi:hypothetical protein